MEHVEKENLHPSFAKSWPHLSALIEALEL